MAPPKVDLMSTMDQRWYADVCACEGALRSSGVLMPSMLVGAIAWRVCVLFGGYAYGLRAVLLFGGYAYGLRAVLHCACRALDRSCSACVRSCRLA